jgi:hypothetical protein
MGIHSEAFDPVNTVAPTAPPNLPDTLRQENDAQAIQAIIEASALAAKAMMPVPIHPPPPRLRFLSRRDFLDHRR